jgi:uncharacterized protein
MRVRFVCALLMIWSLPVQAAETVAPQAAQSAMPQGSYLGAPRDSYQIFMFGDGLASGVLASLKAALEQDALIKIDGRMQEESGLARPDIHDWAAALPKIQESNRIDIAVIMLGVNDSQPMSDNEKGFAFGTDQWKATYGTRVDTLIDTLKSKGSAVYWLGLPPLGARVLDANMGLISDVQKARAQAAGVKFIDVSDAFGANPKSFQRGDGISLTVMGQEKVAQILLAAIRADIGSAFGSAETAGLSPDGPQGDAPASPLFGQLVSPTDGVEGVMRPAYRPPSTLIAGAEGNVVTGRVLMERLIESTATGSSAEALFMKGQWPSPKPGRVDDFNAAAMSRP